VELEKSLLAIASKSAVAAELHRLLSAAEELPREERGSIHGVAGSKKAVRAELRKGVRALMEAMGDKRLEVSEVMVQSLWSETDVKGLVEWFFREAAHLAQKVEGEEAEKIEGVFGAGVI